MKSKDYINKEVETTFNALNTIEKVEVNHFFKHKVLQKMYAEKEEKQTVFSWFTPQLQLATLSVILLLNVGTIFYAFHNSTDTSSALSGIEAFAKDYALQSESNSILN
ncbi:hypothetical protein [Polaribacter sp.]|uniref:hypothetical protein n=1 Tax=Polaribacter sp. TaxID=1920175 RepID=UPI003EF24C87